MRPQTKPFTVEIKKSRKNPHEHPEEQWFSAVKPTTAEPVRLTLTHADQLLGAIKTGRLTGTLATSSSGTR